MLSKLSELTREQSDRAGAGLQGRSDCKPELVQQITMSQLNSEALPDFFQLLLLSRSVAQSCLTLGYPWSSTIPVLHHVLEFAQTHVH